MIYITGDTHGDEKRFAPFKKLFPKRRDHLLVCGDFGFIWNGSPQERKTLSRLERLDCMILFVEGVHDNLDLLESYPLEEYCGGKVRRIGKNILWMQRGEFYTIEGVRIFALGGGESEDADEREAGVNWWPRELPSAEELAAARAALQKAGDEADIIITHQHPDLGLGLVDPRRRQINALGAFLRLMAETIHYRHWYFGGLHIDRTVTPKMTAVFEKILRYQP
ncbi:MAG: hypothetical protein DBX44_00665 [Oscillospiraceae bacterium]|nr:MAG: hypothetical protein DBX44_00665 [Oscillospiraceae bacterium]